MYPDAHTKTVARFRLIFTPTTTNSSGVVKKEEETRQEFVLILLIYTCVYYVSLTLSKRTRRKGRGNEDRETRSQSENDIKQGFFY